MELGAGRVKHVRVGSLQAVFLFLFVRGEEIVEVRLGIFFAKDFDQGFFGTVFLVVEDEPARRFGEAGRNGEEDDRVYLHDDDGETPGPLVGFAQIVGQDEVDQEGHIEAKDVGLEFLG